LHNKNLSNTHHHTSLLTLHNEQLFFHFRHTFPDLATVKWVAAQAAGQYNALYIKVWDYDDRSMALMDCRMTYFPGFW